MCCVITLAFSYFGRVGSFPVPRSASHGRRRDDDGCLVYARVNQYPATRLKALETRSGINLQLASTARRGDHMTRFGARPLVGQMSGRIEIAELGAAGIKSLSDSSIKDDETVTMIIYLWSMVITKANQCTDMIVVSSLLPSDLICISIESLRCTWGGMG